MYNNRVKNLELPENLFSNLGELKSRKIENKPLPPINNTSPILNDFKIDTNVKLTNYSDRKEYRDRIDRMYEDIKGIVPIDNEIDNILYFNNYVEKGIVVKPKITSLKQFWTEYRLINNEKIEKKHQEEPVVTTQFDKELDSFDKLFNSLSQRVSEINEYIDELKEMRNSIDKTSKKLAEDKEQLANERSEFNTYKQKEETNIRKEKENLQLNFNRLQSIIKDLDKKLVSIDTENQ